MHTIRLSVALLLLLGTIGCGKKDSTQASNPKDSTVPTAPSGESSAASLSAAKFVKAVQDGKATSAMLTPAFKKVIAPPELESDKAAGYSESGVRTWLSGLKEQSGDKDMVLKHSTSDLAIAKSHYSGAAQDGPANTYLWLVRSGSSWLIQDVVIDYVFSEFAIPDGEQAATQFAAWSFADAVAKKNISKAEARMTKALKAKLAPPLFDSDKEQGYSSTKLKSALEDLFPGVRRVVKIESSLLAGKFFLTVDGSKTIGFKLTPGEFLIDELQQK